MSLVVLGISRRSSGQHTSKLFLPTTPFLLYSHRMYNLITPSLTPNQLTEMLSSMFRRSSSSASTVHSNTSETTLVSPAAQGQKSSPPAKFGFGTGGMSLDGSPLNPVFSSSEKEQAKQLKKQKKEQAKLVKQAEKKRRQAERPAYQPEFTGMAMGGAGMPSMGGSFFAPPPAPTAAPMVPMQPFADSPRSSFVQARLSVASGMFSPSSPRRPASAAQTMLEDKYAASSVMIGGPVLAYRFSTK